MFVLDRMWGTGTARMVEPVPCEAGRGRAMRSACAGVVRTLQRALHANRAPSQRWVRRTAGRSLSRPADGSALVADRDGAGGGTGSAGRSGVLPAAVFREHPRHVRGAVHVAVGSRCGAGARSRARHRRGRDQRRCDRCHRPRRCDARGAGAPAVGAGVLIASAVRRARSAPSARTRRAPVRAPAERRDGRRCGCRGVPYGARPGGAPLGRLRQGDVRAAAAAAAAGCRPVAPCHDHCEHRGRTQRHTVADR